MRWSRPELISKIHALVDANADDSLVELSA
jgi:hypothetical protein